MKKAKLLCHCSHPPKQEDENKEEAEHCKKKPLMFQLPNHLMVDIFCKIPPKTLIQCKRVCKSWRCLLSDPQFTKDLFSRTSPCVLVRGITQIGPKRRKSWSLDHFLVDLNDEDDDDIGLRLSKDPKFQTFAIHIVNSCNGFLCLCRDDMERELVSVYLSNPVTVESVALPSKNKRTGYSYYCGFGFSPISNVYKVVMIEVPHNGLSSNSKSRKPEAMVMTVGSGIWRSINNGDSLSAFEFGFLKYGIYLNGILHWISWCGKDSPVICAFDVETECFQPLLFPLPLQPLCSRDFGGPTPNLVVLKGWLAINVRSYEATDVWVMKDYGVKESWTQVVDIDSNPLCLDKPVRVLNLTEEGQAWLLDGSELQVYTPRTGDVETVEFDELEVKYACAHVPSFVSLNDVIRG